MHDDVSAAWERVMEKWDDPARHDTLLGLVAQHSCFAWAAARYKERAGDAIADKQLERLRRAATATMLSTATIRNSSEGTPYKRVLIVFTLMLAMLVLGLVAVKMLHDLGATTAPVTKPVRH